MNDVDSPPPWFGRYAQIAVIIAVILGFVGAIATAVNQTPREPSGLIRLNWSTVFIEGLINAAILAGIVVVVVIVVNGPKRSNWEPVDDRVQPAQRVAQTQPVTTQPAEPTRPVDPAPQPLFVRKEPPSSIQTLSGRLAELQEARDRDLITEDEWRAKRAQLIDRFE